MLFVEGTYRDYFGDIVIRSKVKSPPGRKDYEKMLWPGIEVGLISWERSHSQGNITGNESPNGIRYAPSEVNQKFQRLGIEKFIAELFLEKPIGIDIWLTTVTKTHPRSLRLKEIQYVVDIVKGNQSKTLFEASIEIEDKKFDPQISIEARPRVWF